MAGPLNGIRVLDLSRVLAGPWSMQNFGDLGADVLKIEKPGDGDDSRHWGPPWLKDAEGKDTRQSAYYLSANRNKRSVAIDISKPRGQELIRRLVEHCDIFIENYKVGGLAKYGLNYENIRKIRPDIIYLSLTGFGQTGPHAERPGYDYLFQGLGGLMSVTGERDGLPGAGPQRMGLPVIDLFTGMYSTVAMLAALHHRNVTGQGQHIDVSLHDVALAVSSGAAMNYLLSGTPPTRTGNASPNIAPYGVFPCADGELIIACGNQSQYVKLCGAIGRPELATDERFAANGGRLKNFPALFDELSVALKQKTRTEWEDILYEVGVPAGPINDYKQALEHPQSIAHQNKIEMDHPFGVKVPGIASPFRFSESQIEYRLPPPLLGQHTREVLGQYLSIGEAEFGQLVNEGVIGDVLRG